MPPPPPCRGTLNYYCFSFGITTHHNDTRITRAGALIMNVLNGEISWSCAVAARQQAAGVLASPSEKYQPDIYSIRSDQITNACSSCVLVTQFRFDFWVRCKQNPNEGGGGVHLSMVTVFVASSIDFAFVRWGSAREKKKKRSRGGRGALGFGQVGADVLQYRRQKERVCRTREIFCHPMQGGTQTRGVPVMHRALQTTWWGIH